jgi:hypothetical protein
MIHKPYGIAIGAYGDVRERNKAGTRDCTPPLKGCYFMASGLGIALGDSSVSEHGFRVGVEAFLFAQPRLTPWPQT